MVEVSVVIVTWNADKFVKNCLDSVFAQETKDLEVILVDNGSSDKTLAIVREYLPKIKLIENKENKGFCQANNQALKESKGKFILTLNSDIVLEKDYINNLKKYLTQDSKIGMVQGKFLRLDNKTIDGAGLYLSLARRFFNLGEGEEDGMRFQKNLEIFGPCAAAALYKRELVEDIAVNGEFFDDSFFFLVEDFDVAWRARNRGWKAMYVAQALCWHYRNSAQHGSLYRQYLSFRNRYLMIIKNERWWRIVLHTPFFLFYDIPRIVILLFKNPYTLKAIREIIAAWPQLLRKRGLILSKI